MSEVCTDNRFDVIAAYKKKLIESTNIETSPNEMAVIDNVLFRFWQMGWLPPVPHGRLIDADELAQRFNDAIDRAEKDKTDYCNAFIYHGDLCTEWWCVNGMLEKAPTIIPAEEDKI